MTHSKNEKGNLILIQQKITLPLVLDLIPGTVKWRFVSDRQLDNDLLMAPTTSSLRSPLIRASNDKLCGESWRWVRLAFTRDEEEEAESILSVVFPVQRDAEVKDGMEKGGLTTEVFAVLTPVIGGAIFLSGNRRFGSKVGDFIWLRCVELNFGERSTSYLGSRPSGLSPWPNGLSTEPLCVVGNWEKYTNILNHSYKLFSNIF